MELEQIKCEYCGHENPSGTQLCQSCGKMINSNYDKRKIKDVMRYDGSAIRSKTRSKTVFDKIWIFFTSIKVGVILILILTIGSAIGTIFPQEYFIPIGVNAEAYYAENYGTLGTLYFELGFHNLYSSWWFIILTGLLALSIIAASIDRGIPLYKSLKNQRVKKHPTYYKRQRIFLEDEDSSHIGSVIQGLEKRRYKVTREGKHFLLEKGRLSRWGPYINHVGLIILLFGSMLRFFPGMYVDEIIYIQEGDTVQVPNTDGQYYIENNEFIVDIYDENSGSVFDTTLQSSNENVVSNYQTNMTFYENTSNEVVGASPNLKEIDTESIQVNHPYRFDNFELYQSSFDNTQLKTMTFRLEDSEGNEIGEQFTVDLENTEEEYNIGEENIIVNLRAYAPDFLEVGDNGTLISETPIPNNPAFVFEVSDGESIELSLLQIMNTEEITEDNQYSIRFVDAENHMATVLTLKKDLTMPIIATGFIIFLIGLSIGSYINHRRIWINSENKLILAAHTNKNYFGLIKELNNILKDNGYDKVSDRQAKNMNDTLIRKDEV